MGACAGVELVNGSRMPDVAGLKEMYERQER